MTPQEKALELFTTFRYALSHKDAPLGMYKDNIAIQCALIAVDEIIKQSMDNEYSERYWNEVKQEIQKL